MTTPLPPTPRCDAEVYESGPTAANYGINDPDVVVDYTFAQQLERELIAADQARADLETEVQRLKQAAEELSFLHGDLLLWTEWAVDKGNANCDLEEAWERYEEWLKARTALKETP